MNYESIFRNPSKRGGSPRTGILLSMALAVFCLLPGAAFSAPWVYSGSGNWTPPSSNLLGLDPGDVPMDAKVFESPARIDLRVFKAGTYRIYRKDPASTTWGAHVAEFTAASAPSVWSDTNIVVGQIYEYGIGSTTTTKPNQFGNVLAGIKFDRTQARGRIALVVAQDIPSQLPDEYAQYKTDLVADGWVVHEIPTPRANDSLSNFTATNALSTITVTTAGTGYTNGQNIVIFQGTATALGTITANTTTGVITSVAVNYSGGGFVSGQPLTFTGTVAPATGGVLTANAITSGTAEHINIRNQLIALYNTYPTELKNVVLLGKVAVARSGVSGIGPDGHGNRASVGADAYYADMDGVWTDTGQNYTSYSAGTNRSNAIKDGRINVRGDNKFDATYFYEITNPNSRLELGFGRIDFSNSIPSEYESMRMYFNKLHRYKTAAADFQPGRRVCNRMNAPPTGDTVQTAMLRSMPGLVGMENITLITNQDTTDAPKYSGEEDRDSAYTRVGGPFLFYFKGSGPPAWGLDGRAVFWTGLQSHWGYWFEPGNNTMLRRLAEDNFALSFTWSIWGVDLLYHRMGMGFEVGEMMRLSMNERTWSVNNYAVTSTPTGLFINHLGCPSLRLFMFEPPTNLSVVPSGSNPALSWTASPASGVTGYHIYRSTDVGGPFTRLTTTPVTETTYLDNTVSSGVRHYQVKAVRLETTGGGTYSNTSLGVQQSVDLTGGPAALSVTTAVLPDSNWNAPYQATLKATGGTPVFNWTIFSGALPPGLTLSPSGAITGLATIAGAYPFTVQATDQLGQTAQGSLLINVQSNNARTFYAEANSYCGSFNTTRWSFGEPSLLMSGPVYLYQPFLRFDISGLVANNSFTKAKLILTFDERSQGNSYALVKAAMTQDAGDGWTESGITWATRPLDDASVPEALSSSFPVAYGSIELDVTDFVRATLANDPAKKLGLRLSTTLGNTFGNEVRIVTRYAPGNARPRLVIETTDAPAIAFQSPTVNPASIHVGSSLVINATATAIPAQTGSLSVQWSKMSGPGTVTFSSLQTASTTAAFSAAGDYVLRLAAQDSVLSSFKDLTVRVLAVPAATSPVTGPTDGLIMRLPFDEGAGTGAADVSGSSPANNGAFAALASSGLPTWLAQGKIGGAVDFNGSGQRIEIEDSATTPLDGMQKMTASLWVKLNAADANAHAILVKRTSSTTSTTSYAITLTNAEKVSVSVANKTAVTGDNILAVGEWYHVVMVYDGSLATNNLQLYLNGSPEKFGTISTGVTNNAIPRISASKLRVGDYTATAVTAPLNGQVDEVRLYNRVLTLDEIQELAQAKPSNMGPKIALNNASVSGTAGQPLAVGATVTDDGLPGAVSVGWTKPSGPGSVVYSTPVSNTTDATASAAGSYALRITANDGSITTFADVAASFQASGGIESWRMLHFGTTNNLGDAADGAILQPDGLSNLLKYALGLDPSVDYANSALAPKGEVEQVSGEDRLTYTFTRDTAVTDATISVEVINDLTGTTWTGIDPLNPANQVSVLENTPSAGIQTITVKDIQPITASSTRFMRLKVTRP